MALRPRRGHYTRRVIVDPDGQRLLDGACGANAPVNILSEEIYTEITL